MDEKDLLIFLTLAETGNLTRTAEKLYLAQPTLSKRLQNMEAELGAQLFLRSKHGVALTPAGEAARETIQKTVDDFEAPAGAHPAEQGRCGRAPCGWKPPSITPTTAYPRFWRTTRPVTPT